MVKLGLGDTTNRVYGRSPESSYGVITSTHFTEGANMIRLASEPTPWVKKPERKNTDVTAGGSHPPGKAATPIHIPVDKAVSQAPAMSPGIPESPPTDPGR